MDISRRGAVIGLAACASALTLSSCRGGSDETPTTSSPPRPSDARSVSPTPRTFPGQPSSGTLFYGASLPYHRSLEAWERELGSTLGLHRSYFVPDAKGTSQLVAQCRSDLAEGRVPHVSIKPLGTWADVASRRHDDWLTSMLRPLGELDGPILFTLHHEPENDAGAAGMIAADFVGMQERLIALASDLAESVTIAPVLQHWTFDPMRTDVDPAAWLVPGARVAGIDVYNPWSPTNGKEWRTFGSKIDEVLPWFGDTPIVVGEYGCREDPQNPGLTAQWLRDAADYARTHHIVSMSYFNSHVGAHDGSWELSDQTERTFAELLAAEWVVRPPR